MITVDFSESIEACDLKVGRCRQLIHEGMLVFKVKVIFDVGTRSFTYENQNLLFSETAGPF